MSFYAAQGQGVRDDLHGKTYAATYPTQKVITHPDHLLIY